MILSKAFSQRRGECCGTEGKMETLVLAGGAAGSYPAVGRLWQGGGVDEGSGAWVQHSRWGTFPTGALISKQWYMIIYEADHRTRSANGLWGVGIAFAAAGQAYCMFTSDSCQLLVRGAQAERDGCVRTLLGWQ